VLSRQGIASISIITHEVLKVKIETDAEYKLISKLAYNLSFNAPFDGVEFTQEDINDLADAIDAYDVEHGYVMNEPSQEAIDEHERDRNNAI